MHHATSIRYNVVYLPTPSAEENTRTSVFPMTESGPGSGGAQTHQSWTVLTDEMASQGKDEHRPLVARTVSILALRRLVVARRAVIIASLTLFGLIGRV